MQAVILAAGKSTRTYPLTATRPKPLLPLANKPLLSHTLDRLKGVVSEAILIVGYKKEMIKKHFGKRYNGIKLTYLEQKEQLGTGHALLTAKKHINGRCIVMAGDDLYERKDILACVKHDNAILVSTNPHPERYGVIKVKNGKLQDIIEKPKNPPSNLINTSFYVLEEGIFDISESLPKSERGEYELTDAVKMLAQKRPVHCIKARRHIAIGYPWDVLKADSSIRKGKNAIGKGCTIKGKIINSSIGDNCAIHGTVKNSVIFPNSIIGTGSVIEDSVIGSNARFNGKITSKKSATSMVNGKKVEAGRFGAALGDGVFAKDASISSGVKISPGKKVSGKITSDVS
jgi:UDP-N-acetylglucosamine diphosphorylase / glucose-1-phosphate thymidylyltransferase / UDP-N-acetylgalactosamine diphosphorylase / glucosamine-1-phosphate N-acetyltransferase / galactosamine-1-phosphate N-acetyltransferase